MANPYHTQDRYQTDDNPCFHFSPPLACDYLALSFIHPLKGSEICTVQDMSFPGSKKDGLNPCRFRFSIRPISLRELANRYDSSGTI
jgi:hypothetical protein